MDLIHSLNHIDWSVLSPIHTHSLQRHVSQLKESTIRAMAYMLTANIDSGLTHAIGIAALSNCIHTCTCSCTNKPEDLVIWAFYCCHKPLRLILKHYLFISQCSWVHVFTITYNYNCTIMCL